MGGGGGGGAGEDGGGAAEGAEEGGEREGRDKPPRPSRREKQRDKEKDKERGPGSGGPHTRGPETGDILHTPPSSLLNDHTHPNPLRYMIDFFLGFLCPCLLWGSYSR